MAPHGRRPWERVVQLLMAGGLGSGWCSSSWQEALGVGGAAPHAGWNARRSVADPGAGLGV